VSISTPLVSDWFVSQTVTVTPPWPLRLEAQQRQGTVPLAGQAKQYIHDSGRNDRNGGFAASRGFSCIGNDVNIDSNGRVDYVRWSVAVEVVLLHMAVVESYRPFRHQLRDPEADTRLELALDGQRIHGSAAVQPEVVGDSDLVDRLKLRAGPDCQCRNRYRSRIAHSCADGRPTDRAGTHQTKSPFLVRPFDLTLQRREQSHTTTKKSRSNSSGRAFFDDGEQRDQ